MKRLKPLSLLIFLFDMTIVFLYAIRDALVLFQMERELRKVFRECREYLDFSEATPPLERWIDKVEAKITK